MIYKIKAALLHYFRFKHNSYVATEVNYDLAIADVLSVTKKDSIVKEVEIKLSKNDFLKDAKKPKHLRLGRIINYFYYCVPLQLKEFALEQLSNSKYGLMVFEEKWEHKNKLQEILSLENSITIIKKATNLKNDKNYAEVLKEKIAFRAMSELNVLYKQVYFDTSRGKQIIREKDLTI